MDSSKIWKQGHDIMEALGIQNVSKHEHVNECFVQKKLLLDYWKTPQPHFEGQMTLSMVESHLWELVTNCQTRTYTINNNGTLPWLPTLLTGNICNLWNSFPWRRRKMPTDCTMNQIKKDRIMATSFLVQNEEFRAQHFDLKEFPICKKTWNCCDCAKETTQNVEPNGQQSFLEESRRLRISYTENCQNLLRSYMIIPSS